MGTALWVAGIWTIGALLVVAFNYCCSVVTNGHLVTQSDDEL